MQVAKVYATVAEGAFGSPYGGCVPLVIDLVDKRFLKLLGGAGFCILGGNFGFGCSFAVVDLCAGQARAGIMLDLGDQTTRTALTSWCKFGPRVDLRYGGELLTVKRASGAQDADLERVLALPHREQPDLFLMATKLPRVQAHMAAGIPAGRKLPTPNFLFSAAYSASHCSTARAAA